MQKKVINVPLWETDTSDKKYIKFGDIKETAYKYVYKKELFDNIFELPRNVVRMPVNLLNDGYEYSDFEEYEEESLETFSEKIFSKLSRCIEDGMKIIGRRKSRGQKR